MESPQHVSSSTLLRKGMDAEMTAFIIDTEHKWWQDSQIVLISIDNNHSKKKQKYFKSQNSGQQSKVLHGKRTIVHDVNY